MYCTTKQGQNTKHPKTIVETMNQQQQTHRLRTLGRSYWGLKLTLLAKSPPQILLLSKQKNNVKLAWRLPYLSTVSSQGNNQLITLMKQRKWP